MDAGAGFQETRQEQRERKLKARRERIPKHGAGLRQSYADAALKLAQGYQRRARAKRR